MRLFLVLSLLSASATFCMAQPYDTALVVGIGRNSCGHWLATPQDQREGQIWVLGFWSGLNVGMHSNTGSTSEGHGIQLPDRARSGSTVSVVAGRAGPGWVLVFVRIRRTGRYTADLIFERGFG